MKGLLTITTLVLWVHHLFATPIQQNQPGQEKVEAQGTLILNAPQQRTLAPDVIHVWSLALEKGQYAVVEVLQKGIDVVVRIVDPTGSLRGEFDSPTGDSGPEKVDWITNSGGTWKVEITPSEAKQAGAYEIELKILRGATKKDRQLAETDSLNNLAKACKSQGKYADAERLYKRCLEIHEIILGVDNLDVAQDLNSLAEVYFYQGKYDEAVLLVQRSLIINEKALGPEHPDVAESLNNLAFLYSEQGKHGEAEPLYKRSLKIREEVLGPEHPDVALSLNNLAALYRSQGKYGEAEPLYKRSLAIREKILGLEHPDVAQSLNNLAVLYTDQGKYLEAEPLNKRSLTMMEKSLGMTHPQVAQYLYNLATLYMSQGKYAEAERLHKRAIWIRENALGPEHPDLARSLNSLGVLYYDQSKYIEAGPIQKRALEIREKALGVEHPDVAESLNNLANLYKKQDKYAEAESLHKRALGIREKAFGSDHPYVAITLHNLAGLYLDLSKYADAEPLYMRSLVIWESKLGPDHPYVAFSLNNLARIAYLRGEKNALPLMERAIRIFDITTGYPNWKVNAYALRAQIHKQKRDLESAIVDLTDALRLAEKLRPQIGGGEETLAGFFEQYIDHFNRMVAWQVEIGQIEKALLYAERGRARALLDNLALGQIDLRNSIPTEIRVQFEKRETDAKAQMAQYQQRIRLLRSRKDLNEEQKNHERGSLQDSLGAAERYYLQIYEEIKQASPLWHNLITSGGQPVALADIQNRLVPKNSLMLLYQIGKEGSYLFVIPPTGQMPEAISLQVPDKVASLLEVEVGSLKSTTLQKILVEQDTKESNNGLLHYLKSRNTDATQTKSTSAKLHALWQVLVPASLWSRLVASSEVIIIPDGVLNLLPFEALVVQTGSKPNQTRYWLDEGPVIRYAPSATTLYNLEQRQVSSSATSTSALSLSDPIFDPKTVAQAMQQKSATKPAASHDSSQANVGEPDSLSVFAATRGTFERASGALLRLEATARETEEIRKAFGRKSVVALMRLDANEPKLRAELAGKRYLHLATHGVVDQQRSAMFAALVLTPPPNETNVAENDGFLQLYEIYDLKLPDCELAVLSACKTNFGRYFEGEGVFALSRGFLAAGARRVIASQWDVDDASTAKLIGEFFQQIAAAEKNGQKTDFALALREAKRKVRSQQRWAAPYFWATFVLTGKR